jgi:hypothetical protein
MAVLQSTRVAMNDDGERARCSFGDFGDLVTTVAKIMADRHSEAPHQENPPALARGSASVIPR